MAEPTLPAADRILIIDDNVTIHADFRKILSPPEVADTQLHSTEALLFGEQAEATPVARPVYQVDSAAQGEEGLRLVEKAVGEHRPYALAFVDVRMPPGWDGIETVSRLWQKDPDLPVVICTAYSDYSWPEMMKRLGYTDNLVVLRKPFETVEVLQLAHSLTRKWLLARQIRAHIEELDELVRSRTRSLQETNEALQRYITERMQMENQLRQAQRIEAVGQLSAGVAHHFNNLLGVIQGHAELQLIEGHADESLLDSLREISQAASRAAVLTRQLLAFSRKQMLRPQALDLSKLLGRLGRTLQRTLSASVQLHIQCGEHVPPVLADEACLEQVILHLIANACDAMPQGGPLAIAAELAVVDAAHKKRQPDAMVGSFIRLSVADQGKGMEETVQRKIFEPFFTTKEVGKGSGMGLATAYGIVKQHQGWIEVESKPGAGSIFTVFLPPAGQM